MTASPMKVSTVAPCRSRIGRIASKKWDIDACRVAAAGSPETACGLGSANTTVTVRRVSRLIRTTAPHAAQRAAPAGIAAPHAGHVAVPRVRADPLSASTETNW